MNVYQMGQRGRVRIGYKKAFLSHPVTVWVVDGPRMRVETQFGTIHWIETEDFVPEAGTKG